jgi:hypothetical protein
MPTLLPPYIFYMPLTNVPGRTVDRLTGSVAASSTGGEAFVTVANTATIPGDVIALAVYSTIEVTFNCSSWAGFFGYSSAYVEAVISLFNNRSDQSRIHRDCTTRLGTCQSWIGSHGTGLRTLTASLRCDANWGRAYGVPNTWSFGVSLRALARSGGWAGASASISTIVRQIDYEMFWPA